MVIANNILRKFLEFSIGNWISMAIGFISTPIITRMVIPDDFGKFGLFTMVCNFLSIIALLGLDQAFLRFYYEEDQQDGKYVLFQKCLKWPVYITTVLSVLILIFYQPISKLVFGYENFHLVVLVIINIYLLMFNRFSMLLLRVLNKSKSYSLIAIIQKTGYLLFFIFISFLFQSNYFNLIYSSVLSLLIVTLFSILDNICYWKKTRSRNLNTHLAEVYKFAFPLVFTSFVYWLFESIDKICIKIWSNYAELGLYVSASSIASILNIIQVTFTTYWVSLAYETYKKDEKNVVFFENVSQIISYIMFMLATLLIIFREVFLFLLGEKFHQAIYLMPFLMFVPCMYTISEATVMGINFFQRTAIILCILNLIGNLLLVPSLGAKGAAISTGVSYFGLLILRTIISQKFFKVNYHLFKMSFTAIMLIIYASYATFYTNRMLHYLIGILLLILISALYYRFLKEIIKKGERIV